MFTLTVDRSKFHSAEAAHTAITEGGFIRRLMRRLGVPRWLWALEFQQKTGEGWPHWHLLIDLAGCPGGRVDLKLAWHLWRDVWGLGGLDLNAKATKAVSARHAVFYITKYLTKPPAGGFPVWVLGRHGIRFVQGSRSLGPLAWKPKKTSSKSAKRKDYACRKSLLERMAGCEQTTNAFDVEIDETTGAIVHRFVGTINASISTLEDMAICERFDGSVNLSDVLGEERTTLNGIGVTELNDVIDADARWRDRAAENVHLRRVRILERNAYAKRQAKEQCSDNVRGDK